MTKHKKFRIESKDNQYLTVVEEKERFYICVVGPRGKEIDSFIDPFTNRQDAETACDLLASVM